VSVVNGSRGVHKPLIGTVSPEFAGFYPAAFSAAAPANSTWGTANLARAYPFVIWQPITVVKLWLHTGNTNQSTQFDLGIYTFASSPARLVSAGATTFGADNLVQEVDITDTLLLPGWYYYAVSCNTASATTAGIFRTVGHASGAMIQQTSAHPLPSSLTPAVVPSAFHIAFAGMSLRTLVT
jgi:hypothetical protein